MMFLLGFNLMGSCISLKSLLVIKYVIKKLRLEV